MIKCVNISFPSGGILAKTRTTTAYKNINYNYDILGSIIWPIEQHAVAAFVSLR